MFWHIYGRNLQGQLYKTDSKLSMGKFSGFGQFLSNMMSFVIVVLLIIREKNLSQATEGTTVYSISDNTNYLV